MYVWCNNSFDFALLLSLIFINAFCFIISKTVRLAGKNALDKKYAFRSSLTSFVGIFAQINI
jgi:hypothetical protein